MTLAWLAHLYTASGIVLVFLAAQAAIQHDYRTAFFWLAMQVAVDATDGLFARAVRAEERLPGFDGGKLDDIVDYAAYVFVPALIVWRAILVPEAWTLPVAAAMLLASAYGFNRSEAKTADHFFTGFPSYWNIVVFYMLIGGWPPAVNAAVLLVLAVLVFVPIRWIYPSRTRVWQLPTNALGATWAIICLAMLWRYPAVPPALFLASLVFPVYYIALSLWIELRRRR